MNPKEFFVTDDIKVITQAHSLERIKYEFNSFRLNICPAMLLISMM